MRFRVRVIWTQWRIGIWWWPVKKNRAFGMEIGPLHLIWTRGGE